MPTRRDLLKIGAAAAIPGAAAPSTGKLAAAMDAPVLKTNFLREPITIQSLDLLKSGKSYIVRARSSSGIQITEVPREVWKAHACVPRTPSLNGAHALLMRSREPN